MSWIHRNTSIIKRCGKKTAINQGYPELLGAAGETAGNGCSRDFWIVSADSKEIYFYVRRRHYQSGSSKQLQKTGIVHECMAERHLQNDG